MCGAYDARPERPSSRGWQGRRAPDITRSVDFLSALEPGDRLGPYTIVRRMGEGGMGVVYEARSDRGRRVALKGLSEWLVSGLGRQRLAREVQACAQLRHHNIVSIYDYWQSDDGSLC